MKTNLKVLLTICCLGQLMAFASCKKNSVTIDNEEETVVSKTTPTSVTFKGVTYNVGDTVYGYKNYIKLVVGDNNAPLILGVPHDGLNTGSPVIPETGDTGRDLNTKLLAKSIASAFKNDTGMQPWMIINEIGRKRVDPNTYPSDVPSRYTDPEAVNTYNSYHELLLFARTTVAAGTAGTQGALFLDIHGHAHQYDGSHTEQYTSTTTGNTLQSAFIDQTEVGYGLSNFSLEKDNTYLNALADSSSIRNIALAHPSTSFSQLIRGTYSFGALLEGQSVHAVPGNIMQILERNATLFGTVSGKPDRRPYFNGGYCTRKYGTINKGSTTGFNDNIAAIQIETPGITVRNNASIIAISGPRIKKAVINYLNYWYGYTFTNTY
ncbi:hypothetical protein [Mucilaginibacter terrae]|uniref:Succinylglutamate desuccinylase n=1 Tax=Mucilaginibacter terrae TaxID=1955052 RepID=A0ABU3GNT5_9SPHI|nr:hypothetical protein [Mucilaginibacter terrae]MDT3401438.1 hypothetical protein [Mucilaginibacter terrae]